MYAHFAHYLIQCRSVIHIATNLKETCYQPKKKKTHKTININGFVYILMALGRIKSRFQNFKGIVDALLSLKTVFDVLVLVNKTITQ